MLYLYKKSGHLYSGSGEGTLLKKQTRVQSNRKGDSSAACTPDDMQVALNEINREMHDQI